jgi:hypothetical protein
MVSTSRVRDGHTTERKVPKDLQGSTYVTLRIKYCSLCLWNLVAGG